MVVAMAVALVLVAIAVSPLLTRPLRIPRGHAAAGVGLVVVPLPGVSIVAAAGVLELPLWALVPPLVLFLAGVLLIVAGDDDLPRGDDGDPDPPWWPEFEREFSAYERRRGRAAASPRA
jgi:hypothetical protein